MLGKTIGVRLSERLSRKLDNLAVQSRRTASQVIRMLIEDATLDQLLRPSLSESASPGLSESAPSRLVEVV